jgi:hypothetical protein
MEPLDYWRLCDELSIIQAALLIAGEDPSPSQEYVENWDAGKRPAGYEAAKSALSNALRKKAIEGQLVLMAARDINGNFLEWIEDSIDLQASRVSVASLCSFLALRGYKEGFFAPTTPNAPDYIDPNNPHYAPKLAAAVQAWQEITADENLLDGKTPRQAIEKWLRENASRFGLSDDDGNPNKDGIEQISKVANWKPEGGAAKTRGNPTTPKKLTK